MNLNRIIERSRAAVAQIVAEEVATQLVDELTGPEKRRAAKALNDAITSGKKSPAKKRREAAAKAEKNAYGKRSSKKASKKKAAPTPAASTRYNLDPQAVLERLRLFGESGARAEAIREGVFESVPAPVLLRALKKLIKSKDVKVKGTRRAATYFATKIVSPEVPTPTLEAPQIPGVEGDSRRLLNDNTVDAE